MTLGRTSRRPSRRAPAGHGRIAGNPGYSPPGSFRQTRMRPRHRHRLKSTAPAAISASDRSAPAYLPGLGGSHARASPVPPRRRPCSRGPHGQAKCATAPMRRSDSHRRLRRQELWTERKTCGKAGSGSRQKISVERMERNATGIDAAHYSVAETDTGARRRSCRAARSAFSAEVNSRLTSSTNIASMARGVRKIVS
ncbi:hypothetical protein GALL_413290 [mine drainage metagenome]|uniref:Uncharacterized protein n=1 Tax=mine drainage metagenome TaxID=410659 RepID=A0A1J5PZX7_9ZZZZ